MTLIMLAIAGGILLGVFILFVVLPPVIWVTICVFLAIQYHRHKNDPALPSETAKASIVPPTTRT